MLRIGQQIPDFELNSFQNEEIKKVKLSDFKGKWLVLIFYPADFTFVCPTELEEMAELYNEFQKNDAEVCSISTDTAYAHKAWHDQSPSIKKITYPMLSDANAHLSKEFGTYCETDGCSLRATFIIDPDGILKAMEIHDNSIGRSGREILRKLKAAKFVREHNGNVCPASWEPGEETIEPDISLVGKI